jgi:hypothetical protein
MSYSVLFRTQTIEEVIVPATASDQHYASLSEPLFDMGFADTRHFDMENVDLSLEQIN